MNFVQLLLLALASVTVGVSGSQVSGVYCDQIGTVTFSCGDQGINFIRADYTRNDGKFGEPCKVCCEYGNPSFIGPDTDVGHWDYNIAEVGWWVYGQCGATRDLASQLTASCLQPVFEKNECSFEMGPSYFWEIDESFTDPCVGIYKYLNYTYECVDFDTLANSYGFFD